MREITPSQPHAAAAWRRTAARVVEELFPTCREESFDALLDLRQLLLTGNDWTAVIENFSICRRALEEDHYLPFYRLRKILTSHLLLENADTSLASLLRRKNFSFSRWKNRQSSGSRDDRGTHIRLVEQH